MNQNFINLFEKNYENIFKRIFFNKKDYDLILQNELIKFIDKNNSLVSYLKENMNNYYY